MRSRSGTPTADRCSIRPFGAAMRAIVNDEYGIGPHPISRIDVLDLAAASHDQHAIYAFRYDEPTSWL
jgi:hypothetical protein